MENSTAADSVLNPIDRDRASQYLRRKKLPDNYARRTINEHDLGAIPDIPNLMPYEIDGESYDPRPSSAASMAKQPNGSSCIFVRNGSRRFRVQISNEYA